MVGVAAPVRPLRTGWSGTIILRNLDLDDRVWGHFDLLVYARQVLADYAKKEASQPNVKKEEHDDGGEACWPFPAKQKNTPKRSRPCQEAPP